MRTDKLKKTVEIKTWEEKSGFIDFLSRVKIEIDLFERAFHFGITLLTKQPVDIDGKAEELANLGFVVLRKNAFLPERTYCLYSILKGRKLYGYIGFYNEGEITTARELKPIQNYREALQMLRIWLRDLVKASCDKI